MPTGYTAVIEERDVSFKEFLFRCAGAFLIETREKGISDEIPDQIEPSNWNIEQLEKYIKQLKRIKKLSTLTANKYADEEYKEQCKKHEESINRIDVTNKRYEDLLKEVNAWNPPTSEHEGLKKYMINQIKISHHGDLKKYYKIPEKLSGKQWKEHQIANIQTHIDYHTKEYLGECENVGLRNKWVKELKESVKN